MTLNDERFWGQISLENLIQYSELLFGYVFCSFDIKFTGKPEVVPKKFTNHQ